MWSLRENKSHPLPRITMLFIFASQRAGCGTLLCTFVAPNAQHVPLVELCKQHFVFFCPRNRKKTWSIIFLINFQNLKPVVEEKETSYGSVGESPQNRAQVAPWPVLYFPKGTGRLPIKLNDQREPDWEERMLGAFRETTGNQKH